MRVILGMHRTSLLILGTVLLSLTPLQAKIERTVEKTFSVDATGQLQVSTQGGFIRVVVGEEKSVKITAQQVFPRARNAVEADEIARNLTVDLRQEGATVEATAKYAKTADTMGRLPVLVNFTVTVPSRFSVRLETTGGDITIGDLGGQVFARTAGGDLDLGQLRGEVEASTSGGDVKLAEGFARTELSTSGGDITVGRLAGPTELSTSGGNIRVDDLRSSLKASTSGGDIEVDFVEKVVADADLRTSGGDVVVYLPKTTPFRVDASTSGGSVSVEDFPLQIEKGGIGKNRLIAAANGGGPLLFLRTSGGDIEIEQP